MRRTLDWIFRFNHLLVLILFISIQIQGSWTSGINVTWISPAGGDVFCPGDTINAQWHAASSVASPSFRLCMSDTPDGADESESAPGDSCGSTVWPTVQQADGAYHISVAVPGVSDIESFHLQMEDSTGETALSPLFSLSPTPVSTDRGSNSAPSSGSPSTTGSPKDAVLVIARNPAPVAAFAVPLSLVAAVLMVAGGLSVYHHRKLSLERQNDVQKLELSRHSSFKSMGSTFSTRSKETVAHLLSSIHQLPYDKPFQVIREPRQPTRQPFVEQAADPSANRTISAGAFRASAHSPRPMPHAWSPRIAARIRDPEEDEANAAINHSVISGYLLPSPRPPSSLLPAPQKLYTRADASHHNLDKPLPPSPDLDIYAKVAHAVRHP